MLRRGLFQGERELPHWVARAINHRMRQLDDSARRSVSGGTPMMGSFKGSSLIFCMIAGGVVAFGLWRGFRLGESLVAAIMLATVVLAGAWLAKRTDARLKRK